MTLSRRIQHWSAPAAVLAAALGASVGSLSSPACAQAPDQAQGAAPGPARDHAPNLGPILAPDVLGGYASDRIMLKLAPGASVSVDARGVVLARSSKGAVDFAVTRELAAVAPTGAALAWTRPPDDVARVRALGIDRWHVVRVPVGTDVPALAARIMAASLDGATVQWAEVDAIGGIAQEAPAPNDPSFGLQWGFENTGQTVENVVGTAGADVRARGAWHVTQGGAYSVIAIIDSGVNHHSDFGGRVMNGWNIPQDNANSDDACSSHGTHVAGVAAASTDNAFAVAGIAPNAFILPVVVLNPCTGLSSWAADGLYWAVDRGATVANLSLQYSVGTQYFYDAVLYTVGSGVPVVAAAGNNGFSGVSWPAKWPEVVAVGSIQSDNSASASSGVGPEVDVAAPGVNVLSTIDTDGVGYKNGTSMACPHVAGAMALIRSVAPALSIAQWRVALETTCVDAGDPGDDTSTGKGRIDAAAAVRTARNMAGIADLNHDGTVSGADLGMLLAAWGACATPCPCDLTDDGIVNGADLGALLSAWGSPD